MKNLCQNCGLKVSDGICQECFLSLAQKYQENDKFISKQIAKEKFLLTENDMRKNTIKFLRKFGIGYVYLYNLDEIKKYALEKEEK